MNNPPMVGFWSKSLMIACVAAMPVPAGTPTLPDSSDSSRSLDLKHVDLALVYEADFSGPLDFVKESELFEDDRRVRKPTTEWVLEGKAKARNEKGRLYLINDAGHLVLWNTRKFPENFLLEFGVSPEDSNTGTNVLFFAATGRDGRDIFDLVQQERNAAYAKYHSGMLDTYQTTYWVTQGPEDARRVARIRKNYGFHLVAAGKDYIAGRGPGPHRVRILKLNGRIEVEVNGKLSVRWVDDGRTHGPVLRDGFIGLRQMAYTKKCGYTHFKVWAASQPPKLGG